MDQPKAISLLKSLSDKYPSDINTLSFYGSALRQSNRLGEAESVYNKILGLQPGNIEALIAMTASSYSQNKPAEAEGYVLKAVNSGLMTRNSYAQLGFSLLVANKNKEAAIYYEKALAMEPRSIDYYNLACAYAKMSDKDNALKALENSLKSGYGSRQQLESDSDFESLKSDTRFKTLLEKLQ